MQGAEDVAAALRQTVKVVVLCLATMLAGCGTSKGDVELATGTNIEGEGMEAAFDGVVLTAGSGDCPVAKFKDNEHAGLVWPAGFMATRDPWIIYRADGSVAAREGDAMLLAGGWIDDHDTTGCGADGGTISVTSVEIVDD